jgi:hypothetical protein
MGGARWGRPIVVGGGRPAARDQSAIDDMVLEAKALQQLRKSQGSASKETRRLDNRSRQLRAQVIELLHEMYVWQVIGTSDTVAQVALSPDEVKQLYTDDGVGPWHETSAGADELGRGRSVRGDGGGAAHRAAPAAAVGHVAHEAHGRSRGRSRRRARPRHAAAAAQAHPREDAD